MIYRSKNALGKLTRGFDMTSPSSYINLTPQTFTNILLTDLDNTVLLDTTSGDIIVNLPSAVNIKGRIYTVKKIVSVNTVTILPNGSETIDELPSIILTLNMSYVSIQSDGVNWVLILDKYDISMNTTDDLVEGTTNLYFRNDRVTDITDPLYDPIDSATNALNSARDYTDNSIIALKNNAPANLDTLGEIASAINNDPNYSITVNNALGLKLDTSTAASTYLTQATAATTYLTIADGATTYLTIADGATTYLTQATAATTYLTIADGATTYLTIADGATTYLTIADGATTYLTQTNAASTYLTQGNASITYLSEANATSLYLKKAEAATTYLSQANASSTYLKIADAATTYELKINPYSLSSISPSGTGLYITTNNSLYGRININGLSITANSFSNIEVYNNLVGFGSNDLIFIQLNAVSETRITCNILYSVNGFNIVITNLTSSTISFSGILNYLFFKVFKID
jgi:hypothetical protein